MEDRGLEPTDTELGKNTTSGPQPANDGRHATQDGQLLDVTESADVECGTEGDLPRLNDGQPESTI